MHQVNVESDRTCPPAAIAPAGYEPSVTVVINCYNDFRYLPDAIASVMTQTRPADQVVVVDDGSRTDPSPLLAAWPQIELVRRVNGGLAAARNSGLARAKSDYIVFLDGDDLLMPNALADGLAAMAANPEAAMVNGGFQMIDDTGLSTSSVISHDLGAVPYEDLLRGNRIAMHATVIFRTTSLRAIGGYDETLRRCEDYDAYLRLAQRFPAASHQRLVAQYRKHGANISDAFLEQLKIALKIHRGHRPPRQSPHRAAWQEGLGFWRSYYTAEMARTLRNAWARGTPPQRLLAPLLATLWADRRSVPGKARRALHRLRQRRQQRKWPGRIPLGMVSMGDLASVRPVSEHFGFDRGSAIDRFYIARFLERWRADIQGHALEIGDDAYCQRFGSRHIVHQDILHVHAGNPIATIVGDMSQPGVLPEQRFDVMVITQTLHLIFDFAQALANLHRALKPGGVLLLTVPGITSIARDEWGKDWFWSFTGASLERLMDMSFGPGNYTLEQFGNAYAATAFLQGLALEEVEHGKVEGFPDPAYPVILGVRAVRVA